MLEELAAVGTSAVSDALDMLGIAGCLAGLSRRSGSAVVSGPAYTVRFEPVTPGGSAPAADYIDDVPAGSVIVLANAGRTEATVWGDVLSEVAVARGMAGTVIDGACRDLDSIRALDYPLWSAGVFMRSGKNRMALVAVGEPVTIAGVTIHPGDPVVADGSGAVAVPAARLAEVTGIARQIHEVEQQIVQAALSGERLADARARLRYNSFALKTS